MKITATTGICLLSSATVCCSFQHIAPIVGRSNGLRMSTGDGGEDDDAANTSSTGDDDDMPIVKSTVKIDDGGSDLTDRFKYTINALLGTFDDPHVTEDTEAAGQGNIVAALLNFPNRFTFTVVGKTNGDDEAKEAYIDQVKRIVGETSGSAHTLELRVTPRGANFVRVSVEVTVESGAIINTIYDELSNVEATVMKY